MVNKNQKYKAHKGSNYQIGIDLGGTKTEIILLVDNTNELYRKRVATKVNTNDNYKLVIENIHNLINLALSKIEPTDNFTIGVGIPGTMDRKTGIVQNANTTWLEGRYFKADLEEKIGREIFMDNDANCFTLAESLAGAAKGKKIVFGIIMGTGCGGGLCLDGTIHSGNHGIAGEWGHFSIDPNGEKCFCGNIGCIDTKLTGTGIARSYNNMTGNTLPAEIIVQKARENDKVCRHIFDKFLDDFGKSVGGLISMLDPDAIVLGGGLSNIPELYSTGVEQVKKYAYHENVRTPILKNILGDSAGVFGAAWLATHT